MKEDFCLMNLGEKIMQPQHIASGPERGPRVLKRCRFGGDRHFDKKFASKLKPDCVASLIGKCQTGSLLPGQHPSPGKKMMQKKICIQDELALGVCITHFLLYPV